VYTLERKLMPNAMERLTQLQAEMNRANMPPWDLGEMCRLSFFEVGGLLYVDYYGLTFREYDEEAEEIENDIKARQLPIFEVLSLPEVASRVTSLTFDGPDEGANGTRDWDFTWLLAQDVTFPELKTLIIKPSPMEAHNVTVLGYEADGQLAGWLSKAPKLRKLTTPSAPNAEFFDVEHKMMSWMRVNAGYDPANFILNLSHKPTPMMATLDWCEIHNRHMDAWEQGATSFEHFEALFSSPGCPPHLTLRNPKLNDEQIRKLVALQRETCRGRHSSLRIFYTSYGMSTSADGDGSWIEREPSGRWRNSAGNEGGS
jgi:hypothetical protein